MGTTVLDPASSTWKHVKLTGIDRHTYWVMPLSLVLNAAVFRIAGFGTYPMRLVSLLWGALALLAWWSILRRLTHDATLALGAAALMAVDFHFQMQAADGRMDVMAMALGYAAIAAYLALREYNFTYAVLASQSLAAASCFTHPNGAVILLQLICTVLYVDRRWIRAQTILVAAAPYLVFGGLWGLYIAQSPPDFAAQLLGNLGGRGPTIATPFAALKLEITHRYLESFGIAPWTSLSGRLNVIPLLVFLAAIIACLAIADIRRQPAFRLLLIWTGIACLCLTFFEGLKTHFYLLYITPLYCVLVAIAARWVWTNRPALRAPLAVVLTFFVVMQMARTVVLAAKSPRRAGYVPAVAYLRGHYTDRTFTMGTAALLFGVGPEWNLLDDVRLGYNTGKHAQVIVVDPDWEDRIQESKTSAPPIYDYVQRVLSREYREVYAHAGWRVLERVPYPSRFR
jgi:4-amino-4-deoxy-L-arabinose transferase-like glycosyltransferase